MECVQGLKLQGRLVCKESFNGERLLKWNHIIVIGASRERRIAVSPAAVPLSGCGGSGVGAACPEKPLCQRLAVYLGISPEALQRLLSFFLSEHDNGKFAVAFQGVKPDMSPLLISSNRIKQYTERHDSLGFLLWFDEGGLRERLESEELRELFAGGGMTRELLRSLDTWMEIVTGHHGVPPKSSGPNRTNYFDSQDEEAAFQYLCATVGLLLIPEDIASLNSKEFGKRLKRLSWVLAGLVVLADWLGSSRQPDTFCQSEMPLYDYWHLQALPFAAQAVHDARLEPASVAPYVNTRHLFDFVATPDPAHNSGLNRWSFLPAINCSFSKM